MASKGGGLGALVQRILAAIAKGWEGGKAGSKWVWKQSTSLASRVWPFGRGGQMQAPPEMELVEEKVSEPITAPDMGWNNDPEADSPEVIERALGSQAPGHRVPGQTYGPGAMEPFDVLKYAQAETKDERKEIAYGIVDGKKVAPGMRANTRNWLMSMNGRQLEALASAQVTEIKRHLENKGHITGVPKLGFGKKYDGKAMAIQAPKQKAPAIDQSQFDVSLGLEMAMERFEAKGMFDFMDGYDKAAMDNHRLENNPDPDWSERFNPTEAELDEMEQRRAPRPNRAAGMRR